MSQALFTSIWRLFSNNLRVVLLAPVYLVGSRIVFSLPVETTCCYTQAISAKFKVNSCCYSQQAFLTLHINTALLFIMAFNAF